MFIGHFGLAVASKRLAPRTSLATLIVGAQFLDLLWPIFLLLGLEHVRIAPGITRVQPFDFYDYPYSHSLTAALGWALAIGLLYYVIRRDCRGAWVVGGLVASHWLLDFLVHRPDLPLWPGGPKYGLGLWNSWAASISVEAVVFGVGIWLYASATRSRDGAGRYGFWSLMVFLFLGWLGAIFGPPPPSAHVLALGGLGMWIVVPWAWWADRHRELMRERVDAR
jgi:hypothetical protein